VNDRDVACRSTRPVATVRGGWPPRRVMITGIGAVTPVGLGREGLWQGVRRGVSAVRRITRFNPSGFPSRIAAEVDGFDPLDYMDARRARRLDRFSQFSLAAALLAVEDARLRVGEEPDDVGVYLGSALGGVAYAEEQHAAFLRGSLRSVSPLLALAVFGGAGAGNVAIELGVTGPNVANANSCASGVIAIGEAFHAVRAGRAAVILAGGVEAPLAPLTFGAFALIKAMSTANDDPARASRPFDRQRDGFVMAEGAAVLVLEEREHALARGAPLYAELLGYGTTNDAYHMTAPLPSGVQAARAVRLALQDAAVTPAEIDFVYAHGSATPLGDRAETLVLKRALGEAAGAIPIAGTKGLHGHALGATGAIETAIAALVLRHDWLPPTANLEEPDADCDLDYIRGDGRPRRVRHILKTCFGFGGINAALVLGRADP
jgi:3-oxoacyl-[acyl-carrier-protein] synthase II